MRAASPCWEPNSVRALDLEAYDFRLFPNPFGSELRMGFTLPTATEARVDLFDISGRAVRNLSAGSLSAGTHDIGTPTDGLAAGTYLLRVRFGDRVATRRVVRQ